VLSLGETERKNRTQREQIKHNREFELTGFIFVSVSRESIEFTFKRD
jgi:hypothetical protein